jgi:hypothetical protein
MVWSRLVYSVYVVSIKLNTNSSCRYDRLLSKGCSSGIRVNAKPAPMPAIVAIQFAADFRHASFSDRT